MSEQPRKDRPPKKLKGGQDYFTRGPSRTLGGATLKRLQDTAPVEMPSTSEPFPPLEQGLASRVAKRDCATEQPGAVRRIPLKVRIRLSRPVADCVVTAARDLGVEPKHLVFGLARDLRKQIPSVLRSGALIGSVEKVQRSYFTQAVTISLTEIEHQTLADHADPARLYPKAIAAKLGDLASHLMTDLIEERFGAAAPGRADGATSPADI